jgi:ribonuclease BN (tRNA processing enzyme)
MHPDHIFGLSTVILYSSMKVLLPGEKLEPLSIYGPQGIHEYVSMSLKLCESTNKREIIIHEFILNDIDSRRLWGSKNPWRKARCAYNHPPAKNAPSNIKHIKLYSNSEGLWSCVDDSRVSYN